MSLLKILPYVDNLALYNKGAVMAEKTLKSLKEFNANQGKRHLCRTEVAKNGIACPECGSELVDTHPNVTLTSCPPRKNIGCESCDYTGYRIA